MYNHTGDNGYSLHISEMALNDKSGYATFRMDLAPWIVEIGEVGEYTLSYWVYGVKSGTDTITEGDRLLRTCIRGKLVDEAPNYSFLAYTNSNVLTEVEHKDVTYKEDVWQQVSISFVVTAEDLATAQSDVQNKVKALDFCLDRPSGNRWTISDLYIDDITLELSSMTMDKEVVPKYMVQNIASEFLMMGDTAESFDEETVDITFTHTTTNETLTVPGFWDGLNKYVVRVSLPTAGTWNYEVDATFDRWDGAVGSIECTDYTGGLDIYEHGFVTESGKYFTYADGTPFFYLGDTHWSLRGEQAAGTVKMTGYTADASMPSGYRYTGDPSDVAVFDMVTLLAQTRASQGFTVIQSEPITYDTGTKFDVTNGITGVNKISSDIRGFRDYDQAFKKIADAGLVHANSQFFFPSYMQTMILNMNGVDYLKPLGYFKYTPAASINATTGRLTDSNGNDVNTSTVTSLTLSQFNSYIANASPAHKVDKYGEPTEETIPGVYRDNSNAKITYIAIYDYTDEFYEYLENLTRYWVARYGAYPVMWTLGQEIDNDFYADRVEVAKNTYWPTHYTWNYLNNPYILIAEYLAKYDAYHHPISGHQEGTTDCIGKNNEYYNYASAAPGTHFTKRTLVASMPATFTENTSNAVSVFENVSAHTWYAAQNSQAFPALNGSGVGSSNVTVAKDYYYNTSKPVVNYEPKYVYLWTKNYGMRFRGWFAFLNGNAGFANGAADLWNYQGTYDLVKANSEANNYDTVTQMEKCYANYLDGLNFSSGNQLTYIKKFFTEAGINFTTLVPAFDDATYFTATTKKVSSVTYGVKWMMAKNSTTYVFYFFGTSVASWEYEGDAAKYDAAMALPDEFIGNYKTEKYELPTDLSGDDLNKELVGVMRLGGYDMPENPTQHESIYNETGIVKGLTKNATYAYRWFNPVTGTWYGAETQFVASSTQFGLPYKPTGTDWVLYLRKV